MIMLIEQPRSFDEFATLADAAGVLPSPALTADPPDYISPVREEGLLLLKPDRDRMRVPSLVAAALVAGFGLGWAGGSNWSSALDVATLNPAQKDTSSPRSETKSANRIEPARKPTSIAAGVSPKPQTTSSVRPEPEALRGPAAANIAPPAAAVAREPLIAAPETRPTTIEGWTVREVRGGAAVLEGPDGIRTASAGDTVPGIGRIDSIVRWGNRWIVATASGLIATP
ncbi:MAG TPA: hypothetical protein VJS63_01280 [Bradyrhizobium sp.]|nr:hypothetical protein [Bradyrhizobium sp.]